MIEVTREKSRLKVLVSAEAIAYVSDTRDGAVITLKQLHIPNGTQWDGTSVTLFVAESYEEVKRLLAEDGRPMQEEKLQTSSAARGNIYDDDIPF